MFVLFRKFKQHSVLNEEHIIHITFKRFNYVLVDIPGLKHELFLCSTISKRISENGNLSFATQLSYRLKVKG